MTRARSGVQNQVQEQVQQAPQEHHVEEPVRQDVDSQPQVQQIRANDLLQGNLNATLGAIESANSVVSSSNSCNLQSTVEGSNSMPVASASNVILSCSESGHPSIHVNNPSNFNSGSVANNVRSNAVIVPSNQSIQMSTSSPMLVNTLVNHSLPIAQTMSSIVTSAPSMHGSFMFNNPLLAPSIQSNQSWNSLANHSIRMPAMQTMPTLNVSAASVFGNSLFNNPLSVSNIHSNQSLGHNTTATVVTQAMPCMDTSTLTTSIYGGSVLNNVQANQVPGIQVGQSFVNSNVPNPFTQSLPSVNTQSSIMNANSLANSFPVMQTIQGNSSIDPSFQQVQVGFSPLNSVCNPLGSMVPPSNENKDNEWGVRRLCYFITKEGDTRS